MWSSWLKDWEDLVLPLLRTHCWVLVDVSASVSCRWMKHNSDPVLDSSGCLDHSNLAEDLSSQSRGSLTPNSLVSVSPLPNLLLSVWKKMAARNHREIRSHSSRVKLPLVKMSASWFLVSSNLIWIFGSNNQSRATLWVLETCLVGLLPLMIILITASLSSNTYNKSSWCENWTFEGTRSTLFKTFNIPRDCWLDLWLLSWPTTFCLVLSWFWIVFPRTKTIRSINREREYRLISILRPKRWFLIL